MKEEILVNNPYLDIKSIIENEELKRKNLKNEEEKEIERKYGKNPKNYIEDKNNLLSLYEIELSNKIIKIFRKQKLCENPRMWTDNLFSPQTFGLCPYNSNGFLLPEGVSNYDLKDWMSFKWLRPEILFDNSNYKVISEEINPNNIIPGCLNDSYFLTALVSLSKYPKVIENLLFVKEKTREHLYGIYLNIHGQWKLVLVDDNFPCFEDQKCKKFVFSYCKNKDIWVSLLEKAWAKVNGCYAKIGGHISPYEVFDVLTDSYTEVININPNNESNVNNLWKKILNAEEKKFIVLGVSINNSTIEKLGLIPGKAYIISKAYEIDNINGDDNEKNNKKFLKLNSPWGTEVFSGDWGETSSKWTETEEYKNHLHYQDKNLGDFFISFNDFINYYSSIGILKIHEDYLSDYIRIKKNKADKCQIIKIQVLFQECHIYLHFYQKNPRIILLDGTYQCPVLAYLILADKNFNYISSISSNKVHFCLDQNLKKGEYYLFCDIN